MVSRADWESAYRELIAEGRERFGDPPTAEELDAFSRGALPEEQAARVRELLVYYPDLAAALSQEGPPPYEGKPGDPDFVSDEELARNWASFKRDIAPPRPMERPAERWLIAASLLLAAVLGSLYGRAQWKLGRPQLNVEHFILDPDDRRGPSAPSPVAPGAQTEHVAFTLQLGAPTAHRDYILQMVELDGERERVIFRSAGLHRAGDGTFGIEVPRSLLQPGHVYRFDLYGVDGTPKLLARYRIPIR